MPEPKYETAVLLEVWGCAKCKRHELPVVENLGKLGEAKLCPNCGSEDIFPLDDGGWDEESLETMVRNTPKSPATGAG